MFLSLSLSLSLFLSLWRVTIHRHARLTKTDCLSPSCPDVSVCIFVWSWPNDVYMFYSWPLGSVNPKLTFTENKVQLLYYTKPVYTCFIWGRRTLRLIYIIGGNESALRQWNKFSAVSRLNKIIFNCAHFKPTPPKCKHKPKHYDKRN